LLAPQLKGYLPVVLEALRDKIASDKVANDKIASDKKDSNEVKKEKVEGRVSL
jgi:hypothetical protein